MESSFRTEQVDTPAGEYTVDLCVDYDPMNPLTDYDQEGMAFYVEYFGYGSRMDEAVDTLDDVEHHAANALRSWLVDGYWPEEIDRRFALWSAIVGSPWRLVTGSDSVSQSDAYRWYALVDMSQEWLTEDSARLVMSDYRQAMSGGVTGFVTKTPNGDVVGSCWGFYDDEEALSEGIAEAEHDAAQRTEKANLAGAGFVGII